MTEGPCYPDGQYVRSDITEGKAGFPLELALTADGSFTGGTALHTGRLFFDETVTAGVDALPPYSADTVTRTALVQGGIYDDGGAASGLLTLTARGGSPSAGHTGALALTLGVER
ncbi:hypothetical protein ACIQJT_05750 [Streptomyces sp. NPDC091972]|uniref:hypothetical protein n=1 Tax=Streptomyces sp. NPDC091972 TaxID=3366007 RepID=UPI0037FFC1B8